MSDQTCLKRHLLYAAVETYHPDGPLYSRAGTRWEGEPPLRVTAPPSVDRDQIDFALVGSFREGIVVAFRGTLPPIDLKPNCRTINRLELLDFGRILHDWRNGFRREPVRDVRIGPRAVLSGAVHHGFADSLGRLWDRIAIEIDRRRAANPAPHLYFTGHSKGGALANLAALCAHQVWGRAGVKAVTFGAPCVGDGDFARAYLTAGIDCQRYETKGDLVPGFPPGGVPVGVEHPVDVPNFPTPLSWAVDLLPWRDPDHRPLIPPPIRAHLPYRDFGYDRHVYESGAAPEWS